MTGTAATSAEEFLKVYGLDVIVIPTNRPVVRLDHSDLIFQTEKGKFQAIAKKVKELNTKGQPVLIGTISIEKNELLSVYLKQEGVQSCDFECEESREGRRNHRSSRQARSGDYRYQHGRSRNRYQTRR